MKKLILPVLLSILAPGILTGCNTPRLANGKYETRHQNRSDYIVVYDDLIFINIKTPNTLPDKHTYWMWAGKYSISDNGEIEFDMDSATKKQWNFAYSFISQNDGIIVNDWTNHTGIALYYDKPQYRQMPNTQQSSDLTTID